MDVGIVGRRGASAAAGLRSVDGVRVRAVCDVDPAARESVRTELGAEDAYERYEAMLEKVDAVVLGTPMHLHVEQAVQALSLGKHVLSEVTAAVSLEELDVLAAAARASSATYMMAENYCWYEENVLVREMARRGLFGRPTFAEGEYIHEVRFLHRNADGSPTWRAKWQVGVAGNTYITHELGPVMQWIRAVDPEDRIVSATCQGSGVWADPTLPHDDTSTTLLKLASGRLVVIRLDMMSNRPHRTFYSLQGTHGCYESGRNHGEEGKVWLGEDTTASWNDPPRWFKPLSEYREMLPPAFVQWQAAASEAGHGGGDFHCAREFALAATEGRTPDVTLEDALEWTAAGLCSQLSIAQGGVPVAVPNYRS